MEVKTKYNFCDDCIHCFDCTFSDLGLFDCVDFESRDEKKDSIRILIDRFAGTNNKNRVQRGELAIMFGSDRNARALIEEAQLSGVRIISGLGSGYWIAADDAEFNEYKRREERRAKNILRKISAMSRADATQVGMKEGIADV